VALVTPAFVMRRSDTKTVVGVAHGLHADVLAARHVWHGC